MSYVLVVDDDPGVRRLMAFAIQAEGYVVQVAGDGREGLAIWKRERPAAIVLDLQMPVMDGWAFFKAIDGPDRPPVIIVSAYSPARVCKELGAEASVTKPFEPGELTAKVAQLMPVH
jgi:CheY-like chemotaxis protein